MSILRSLLLLATLTATSSLDSSGARHQEEQHRQNASTIWSSLLNHNKGPPNLTALATERFSKSRAELALRTPTIVSLGDKAVPKFDSSEVQLKRFKRRTKSSTLMPEFSAPIGNVTAALGRDVRLVCTVENLGKYQVAWLKEETKTILSIDTNIIITNYRIFLIPDEEERKWVLHIKDVQESDRGFYQCQVNTNPMRSTSGYLEVVVPPTIIEAQSSQVAEVVERSNVSIQCKANGHPRPSVSWRRDDGLPIRLNGRFITPTTSLGGDLTTNNNDQQTQQQQPSSLTLESGSFVRMAGSQFAAVGTTTTTMPPSSSPFMSSQLNDVKSDKLTLYDVDRAMAGIYACTASNGIPAHASKRIPVYVKFAPKTSVQNKFISVSLGDQLEVDCLIEAFPKANSYWSKKSVQQLPAAWQHNRAGDPVPLSSSAAARWSHLALVSSPLLDRRALSVKQKQHPPSTPTPTDLMLLSGLSAAIGFDPASRLMNFSSAERGDVVGAKLNQHHHQSAHHEQQTQQLQFPGGHPHNRIQLRQVGGQQHQHVVDSPTAASFQGLMTSNLITAGELAGASSSEGSEHESVASLVNPSIDEGSTTSNDSNKGTASAAQSDSKAYVTVKQTAINLYTYRLRMTISRMQLEDYGEYSCISSNSMGTSESSIIVTKADKISERNRMIPQLNSDYHSIPDERDYQRDSLLDSAGAGKPYTQAAGSRLKSSSSSSSSSSGNRVIYDENYLQAIKTRQSNLVNSGRSQQKLKLRQFSDRNGASSIRSLTRGIGSLALIMEFTVAVRVATVFLHTNFVV